MRGAGWEDPPPGPRVRRPMTTPPSRARRALVRLTVAGLDAEGVRAILDCA